MTTSVQDMIEAIEAARDQKEKGTSALKTGDVSIAKARYSDALDLLAKANVDQPPPVGTGEEFRLLWNEMRRNGAELDLACQLNLALCCIKLERYAEAVTAAGRAAARDPSSAKALFRRGLARAGAGQDEEAKADFTRAAKLAPQDSSIRKELSAVKQRLMASSCGEQRVEAATVAAAMLGGGDLYPEALAGMAAIDERLARCELMRKGGQVAEAIVELKTLFKPLWEEECKATEIAYRQRFRCHLIAGQCHMAMAMAATDPDRKAAPLSKAVADFAKTINLTKEAEGKGRGTGTEPAELAVATAEELEMATRLLEDAKELAAEFPAQESETLACSPGLQS